MHEVGRLIEEPAGERERDAGTAGAALSVPELDDHAGLRVDEIAGMHG